MPHGEGRHREQDSLLDFAANNLATRGLRANAARYEETDTGTLTTIGEELGKATR
ncbi:hypothetical protein ILP97_04805 [Amycolatopsis sp. H6(2020)]|nr:hypothetical protein [Amycolatopsis sp. H6(2020)]